MREISGLLRIGADALRAEPHGGVRVCAQALEGFVGLGSAYTGQDIGNDAPVLGVAMPRHCKATGSNTSVISLSFNAGSSAKMVMRISCVFPSTFVSKEASG